MGRRNSVTEQRQTIEWATSYHAQPLTLTGIRFLRGIALAYGDTLRKYFALSGLSRSKTARKDLVDAAWALVFQVRVHIERSIAASIRSALNAHLISHDLLYSGSFYGASKKQGVSVRFPLSSCTPTKACAAACYAHDVLDAAPDSIVRGVVNGLIAERFENGDDNDRKEILVRLRKSTASAVRAAIQEVDRLALGWTRRPYIRFAHVGEMAAFPLFANAIADQVRSLSKEAVDCVVYTRHFGAGQLDPRLWIVNFTLDGTSQNRSAWVPPGARVVFSAFGGELSNDADVNFLEHHRWSHIEPTGAGRVCPATAPETVDRRCDACECDRCFRRIEPSLVELSGGQS